MSGHFLDFTSTFRLLSQFPSTTSPLLLRFLDLLLPVNSTTTLPPTARDDWTTWLKSYEARLALPSEFVVSKEDRRKRMNAVNPRFTLRQWVLEETIQRLDHQREGMDLAALERVLDMCGSPFEAYGEVEVGEEGATKCEVEGEEERERRRLCGVGSEVMLGFQCSCSS
jgi:uncharacterized protein YdiU (UPF0061 family)